jgi:hypothetical protein
MVPPVSLKLLPARNRELGTGVLWLRNEIVIQCFCYTSVPKLMVYKVVDNMPVTLSQMYLETEELKFRYNGLCCSDDFAKLLKTFC